MRKTWGRLTKTAALKNLPFMSQMFALWGRWLTELMCRVGARRISAITNTWKWRKAYVIERVSRSTKGDIAE
jgi:hypothetical protein